MAQKMDAVADFVSCARAFASSLVSSRSETLEGHGGPALDLADLFAT